MHQSFRVWRFVLHNAPRVSPFQTSWQRQPSGPTDLHLLGSAVHCFRQELITTHYNNRLGYGGESIRLQMIQSYRLPQHFIEKFRYFTAKPPTTFPSKGIKALWQKHKDSKAMPNGIVQPATLQQKHPKPGFYARILVVRLSFTSFFKARHNFRRFIILTTMQGFRIYVFKRECKTMQGSMMTYMPQGNLSTS